MPDLTYVFSLVATAAFSITGVLAARTTRIDIFGILVVGVVTAVGGGTIRDITLDVPVFWIQDGVYLWTAIVAAVATFILLRIFSKALKLLLYVDALGVALFATLAVQKTLALELTGLHAVVMGVITGIGGGIIRDLLTGRETLIMSRELYASPILIGITLQLVALEYMNFSGFSAVLLGGSAIFITRATAIYFDWQMPEFLTHDGRT